VISNVTEHEAAQVIARIAYDKNSRLYDVSKTDFHISDQTPFSQTVSMELYGTDYSDVEISMTGKHQGENLKTALAIIEVLRKQRKIKVERSRLYEGLKRAVQPGRFEVLSGAADTCVQEETPLVIIDGAHNEAGAQALQKTMEEYFSGRRILLITGMLADKQVDDILEHFTKITKDIIITEPDNPRKLALDELEHILSKKGIEPVRAADAEKAVELMQERKHRYDVVLFAGSLYLIGHVRRILGNEKGEKSQ